MLVPMALVFLEHADVTMQLSVSGSCTPAFEARLHFLLELGGKRCVARDRTTAVFVHAQQEP